MCPPPSPPTEHKTDTELEYQTLAALVPMGTKRLSTLIKSNLLSEATHLHNDSHLHDFFRAVKTSAEEMTGEEPTDARIAELELLGKPVAEIFDKLVKPSVSALRFPNESTAGLRKMFEAKVRKHLDEERRRLEEGSLETHQEDVAKGVLEGVEGPETKSP
ncbi:hypothetical protein TeGR_g4736, partial [Tetraparma gracilis]